jgi:uncharacterized membrane protein
MARIGSGLARADKSDWPGSAMRDSKLKPGASGASRPFDNKETLSMSTLITIIICLIVYILPTTIALAKDSDNKKGLIIASLLLGLIPLMSILFILSAITDPTEKKYARRAKILAQAIADAQRGAAA